MTQESRNLRGSGRVALGIVSVLAITTVTLNSVEARHYRARVMTHGHDYSPPSSAIVVDANSGNVLYAASPDELRHPASLTKIMTLYLLFERLEAGKLKLDSQLSVSEHASAQAPTKLGLKPGHTIAVEDAIKGLVTKSANDAAVVVGEAIGGNESDFAEMMTKKARALGMSHTVYRNASGLPNDEQVTTARDQALLGRAIQERFPSQYRYFSTLSFTYHGESMRNHNMLLGHVEGVDGIKTGYTQASGFNLVTSVHRNNRRIVAVVLGGASAGARDAKMRSLIEAHIAAASTQHTAAAIAEVAGTKAATRTAAAKAPATYSVASFSPPTALPASKFVPVAPAENALTAAVNDAARAPAVAKPATPVEANDTIKPIHVKTIKVKLTPTQTAGLGPIVSPVRDEQAESGAQPAPLAVAAPSPKAPAPRAAAIAPPVAAPAAAPPVAAAPVPVTAPVAAAPVVAAPPVAAVDAPVAPASVAVPKTAPVAAHTAAPTATSVAAPPVAAAAIPVATAQVAVPKTVATVPSSFAPATAPMAAPVAPASVTVSKTVATAPSSFVPAAAPMAAPVAPASVIVPKTVATAPSSVAPAAAPMAAAPVRVALAPAAAEASAPEPKRDVATRSAPTHTGWMVQVGAFDVERDAQQRLTNAHAKVGHALDNADPFTEPVMKGDKTLYRARFAGFQQKDEADAVCKQLKRNDIDCMTIRN